MDNPEEVMQILERFNVSRNPEITAQLDEYVAFVARTGDSVYNWTLVKNLYREKLVNVITEFYNETPTKGKKNKTNIQMAKLNLFTFNFIELPQYPNVDPFNYETMKKVLIEKLDSFAAAPFTIQRISELLSDPRKQYSRIDKFMRAVEKTILVVSTVPPGRHRSESENGDSLDSALNGDFATEVNVDVEMDQEGTTAKNLSDGYQRPELATLAPETVTVDKKVSQAAPEEGETSEIKLVHVDPPKVVESAPADDKLKEETVKTDEKLNNTETLSVITSPVKEENKTETAQESTMALTSKAQDDELSNKPIQPTDTVLVNTSEIPSEPTPLAALENIVAIRTETIAEVTELTEQKPIEAEILVEIVTKTDEVDKTTIEDAETASKRLKLSETEETSNNHSKITSFEEEVPKPEEKTETTVDETPSEPASVEKINEITGAPTEVKSIAALPVVELPEVKPTIEQAIASESSEPVPVVVDVPVEDAPIAESIAEAPTETEMETVPTVTENTMSLDEDEPPTIELEMTPIANKMDTDETEAAPMDCEETEAEPMDQ